QGLQPIGSEEADVESVPVGVTEPEPKVIQGRLPAQQAVGAAVKLRREDHWRLKVPFGPEVRKAEPEAVKAQAFGDPEEHLSSYQGAVLPIDAARLHHVGGKDDVVNSDGWGVRPMNGRSTPSFRMSSQ